MARNTVKRYLAAGGYVPYQSPARPGKLSGLEAWLQEQFLQHRGNCDVVRQELARVHGQGVSLRTVERACRAHRAELAARACATLRFEAPPGKQMQIDFGVASVEIFCLDLSLSQVGSDGGGRQTRYPQRGTC